LNTCMRADLEDVLDGPRRDVRIERHLDVSVLELEDDPLLAEPREFIWRLRRGEEREGEGGQGGQQPGEREREGEGHAEGRNTNGGVGCEGRRESDQVQLLNYAL
jgi:hypothetical protein